MRQTVRELTDTSDGVPDEKRFLMRSRSELEKRRSAHTRGIGRGVTRTATLLETAMELFPLYVKLARIERISRIAVCYINHLNLSISPVSPLADYMTAVPPTPPGLVESVSSQSC